MQKMFAIFKISCIIIILERVLQQVFSKGKGKIVKKFFIGVGIVTGVIGMFLAACVGIFLAPPPVPPPPPPKKE